MANKIVTLPGHLLETLFVSWPNFCLNLSEPNQRIKGNHFQQVAGIWLLEASTGKLHRVLEQQSFSY